MKKVKKLIIFSLVGMLIFSNSILCQAISTNENTDSNQKDTVEFNVACPAYPDAYIESDYVDLTDVKIELKNDKLDISNNASDKEAKEFTDLIKNDSSLSESVIEEIADSKELVGIVTATVMVEETYSKVGDEYICTESRLLSENEVNSENAVTSGLTSNIPNLRTMSFLKTPSNLKTMSSTIIGKDYNYNGKLTLNFAVYKVKPSSHKAEYELVAISRWASDSYIPGEGPSPAGKDYIGFVWGGGFTHESPQMYGMLFNTSLTEPFDVAQVDPNKGYVWQFYEIQEGGGMSFLYDNMTSKITLYKNKLTGGGNETCFVCNYIHTYQSFTGSIEFSSAGAAFSLSNCILQWPLNVTVTGIPY